MTSADRIEPVDLEALLPAAVRAALKQQSLERFLAWAESVVPRCLAPEARLQLERDGKLQSFARAFARNLWQSIPLPRLDYRPERLPETGRNEPCPCGSGRKYKHCCLELDRGAEFLLPTEVLWPLVLAELPAREVSRLAQLKRLPLGALADHARSLAENGAHDKAIRLLAPRIAPPWSATDEDAEAAFDTLCELYEESGRGARKRELVEQVCRSAPRSRLRSAAWGRRAAMHADRRQWDDAWQSFRRALEDDPANLSLGALEVQLLIAEGRTAEARERAGVWAMKARRAGDEWQHFAELLQGMASDPDAALGRAALSRLGAEVERLRAWAARAAARPAAPYELEDGTSAAPGAVAATESLAETLRGMGIDESQIAAALRDIEADIEALENAPETGEAAGDGDAPEARSAREQVFLATPPALAQLERQWRESFPLAKPFSTQDAPAKDPDPWTPQIAQEWIELLEQHPEAADSLSILDDLVAAVRQLEPAGQPWFDDLIQRPLLERSRDILERTLQQRPDAEVPWLAAQNRPALRSLARLYQLQAARDEAGALPLAQRLLALNPNDNHGFRSLVMNGLLARDENAAALELAAAYPDDSLVDMRFGRALALYRLEQLEAATLALREAIGESPKVPRYLAPESVRQPKLSAVGITVGGADEAWYYREEARELWERTPGAIEWLEKVARQVRPSRRSR